VFIIQYIEPVPSVNYVLRAPIFLNFRNFGTRRDTQEKHKIKSFDPQEIYEFDLCFFCRISLRSKVTEVSKNWSAQYIID